MKKYLDRLTAPIVTGVVVVMMLPVGAYAAGQAVTIVDSFTDEGARVTKGALHIRNEDLKALRVEGTVTVTDRAIGRRPFGASTDFTLGDGQQLGGADFYQVPEGKSLVITHVSGIVLSRADGPRTRWLLVTGSGHAVYVAPTEPVTNGVGLTQVFTQQVHLEFEASRTVHLSVARYGTEGRTAVDVSVSGYLLST